MLPPVAPGEFASQTTDHNPRMIRNATTDRPILILPVQQLSQIMLTLTCARLTSSDYSINELVVVLLVAEECDPTQYIKTRRGFSGDNQNFHAFELLITHKVNLI